MIHSIYNNNKIKPVIYNNLITNSVASKEREMIDLATVYKNITYMVNLRAKSNSV